MNPEYINPIPESPKRLIEIKENEQKTPERITIEYQTTGEFKDISKEVSSEPGESFTR
ncbi:MAG: hypothetical protein SCALA701_25410 [Candidatus Scalindua sp.]|nr:hypothetical protein [Planctomycetota bacterium]GJQ59740.1 MAG: hypothetical protein SCALA701_25410 [Candidatus Scalindua sp.]